MTLLMPPTERMLRLRSMRLFRATWCCLHLTPPLWLSGFGTPEDLHWMTTALDTTGDATYGEEAETVEGVSGHLSSLVSL